MYTNYIFFLPTKQLILCKLFCIPLIDVHHNRFNYINATGCNSVTLLSSQFDL